MRSTWIPFVIALTPSLAAPRMAVGPGATVIRPSPPMASVEFEQEAGSDF
jgi:hypothetical protein